MRMLVLVASLSLAFTSVDAQTPKSRRDSLIEQDRRMTPAQRDSVKKFLDDSIKKLTAGFVQKTAAPQVQAQSLRAPTKAPAKYKIVEAVNHPGPAQKRTEIGLPVLVRPASSSNDLAVKLSRGCKSTDFHATCEQILEMAKQSPQGYRFKDIDDVIAYLPTLEARYCVPGKRATMYRLLRDRRTGKTRPIDDWNRPCRTPAPGERAEIWLVDPETGDPFISLDCGNIISAFEPGALQIRFSDTASIEVEVLPPVDTTPKVAPLAEKPAPVAVAPKKDSTKTPPAKAVAGPSHKKRNAIIGSTVVGLGLLYFCVTDWCQSTTTRTVVYQNGGPVNPPNNLIPSLHLEPVTYRRMP